MHLSCQCVEATREWIGIPWQVNTLQDILRKRRMHKTKLRLIQAIFSNLVYAIWSVRNSVVWQKKVMSVGHVIDSIKGEAKIRII